MYSTCTIDPKENEEMVCGVLQEYRELSLVPAGRPEHRVGNEGLGGCGLQEDARKLVLHFDPCGAMDTTGFFCAKFKKAG